MTIVIDPSWMTVPVMAALVLGTLSMVLAVLLIVWAVVSKLIGRCRRDKPVLCGLKLYGGF